MIKSCIFCGKAIEYSAGAWYNVDDGVHHRCIGPQRKEKHEFNF